MGKKHVFKQSLVCEIDLDFIDYDVTEIEFSDIVHDIILIDETKKTFFKKPELIEKIVVGKNVANINKKFLKGIKSTCKIIIDKQ